MQPSCSRRRKSWSQFLRLQCCVENSCYWSQHRLELCWFVVWKCYLLTVEEAGQDPTALTFENGVQVLLSVLFSLQPFSYLPILNPVHFVMSWFSHSSPVLPTSSSPWTLQVTRSFLTLAVFPSPTDHLFDLSPPFISPSQIHSLKIFPFFPVHLHLLSPLAQLIMQSFINLNKVFFLFLFPTSFSSSLELLGTQHECHYIKAIHLL